MKTRNLFPVGLLFGAIVMAVLGATPVMNTYVGRFVGDGSSLTNMSSGISSATATNIADSRISRLALPLNNNSNSVTILVYSGGVTNNLTINSASISTPRNILGAGFYGSAFVGNGSFLSGLNGTAIQASTVNSNAFDANTLAWLNSLTSGGNQVVVGAGGLTANYVGNVVTLALPSANQAAHATNADTLIYSGGAGYLEVDGTNGLPVLSVNGTNAVIRGLARIFVDSVTGSDSTGAAGNATRPFATVRAAIAAAQSGDRILLGPGVYYETNTVFLPANTILSGVSPSATVLVGTSAQWVLTPGNNSRVENMSIYMGNRGFYQAVGGTSAQSNPFTNAVLDNVAMYGESDVIQLNHTNGSDSLTMYNCRLDTKWDTITIYGRTGGSGNPGGNGRHSLKAYGCVMTADHTGMLNLDDLGNYGLCAVEMGSTAELHNCTVIATNFSNVQLLSAEDLAGTKVSAENCTAFIDHGVASPWAITDWSLTNGSMWITNCSTWSNGLYYAFGYPGAAVGPAPYRYSLSAEVSGLQSDFRRNSFPNPKVFNGITNSANAFLVQKSDFGGTNVVVISGKYAQDSRGAALDVFGDAHFWSQAIFDNVIFEPSFNTDGGVMIQNGQFASLSIATNLPNSMLSTNVPLTNRTNTFSSGQNFNGLTNAGGTYFIQKYNSGASNAVEITGYPNTFGYVMEVRGDAQFLGILDAYQLTLEPYFSGGSGGVVVQSDAFQPLSVTNHLPSAMMPLTLEIPTNTMPAAASTTGGAAFWNSNGVVYLLTSPANSTAWAATNKLAP